MADSKISSLRRIDCFAGLSQPVLEALAEGAGLQRIGKGSILIREGDLAHFVYGLVEGTVALESGPAGEATIVDFLETGDIFLVPPAMLQLPYMVTVRAVRDLLVVLLPAEKFRRLAETELTLSVSLNRVLSAHWRLLLGHLTRAKTQDADTRLAKYLTDLSGRAQGPAQLTLPQSKKELAAHLGITPATLSRSLRRLANLGVHTSGQNIEIDDVAHLCSAMPENMQPMRIGIP
jgi:CRP-like cAMP-binding protein